MPETAELFGAWTSEQSQESSEVWGKHRLEPYPYKAGREPPLAICNTAPPPFSVGGIHHFDDIAGFEAQFLVIHGNMVPQGFGTYHTAITDELWREPRQWSQ